MKTLKINKLLLLLVGLVVFNSCVEDDEFNTPNISVINPNIPASSIVPMSSVAGELTQAQGNSSLDYSDDDTTYSYTFSSADQYVEGYVVSSDEGGNFFEEIIIQDRAENPTVGLKLLLDVNPLFVRYEAGRKVFIKLNGLSSGITNGVLTLGKLNDDEVDKISSSEETDYVFRSSEVATLVPTAMAFSDFSPEKTNMYVQLDNVQFASSQVTGSNPLSYASEGSDNFDGERTLESCAGASVVFSTSTFADFKGLTLPAGRGSINAILTRNYFGDTYNVVVNSPEDVSLDQQRCDPVFSELFNDATDNTDLNTTGWLNYAEAGSELWTEQVFGGNGYAEFNPYNSGDASNIGWLITPSIDFDAQDDETLTFETEHAYPDNGHDPLEVLISTDFDGTSAGVATATWTPVGTFVKSYINDFGNWYTFTSSGEVDLSTYTGTGYIAFRYTGSDSGNQNMTLHVDNIKILVP